MADVKWIKISTDIFDDEKILLIESMPDSYALITVWFKLLCLAGKKNNSGVFLISDRIAYTDEMFATIFRMPLNTVRLALDTFETFGMIERLSGVVTIPNWEKHQNLEKIKKINEQTKKRMAEYRERKKIECNECVTQDVTQCYATDKIREDKIREDKNRLDKKDIVRHKCGANANVLLSDDEYQKLSEQFPDDYEERIDNLSYYLASHNKSYKNHYMTILSWARKDAQEQKKKKEEKKGRLDWIDGISEVLDIG